jgi:beta-lactamase superfamily II metal-dependent hydrolase
MTFPGVQNGILQIFDVEHGGCALLTMPTSNGGVYRILIDCGHNAAKKWYPGEHLRSLGVSTLQLLIVTNYDEDHVSGLRNFIEQGVYIEQVLRNPAVSPATIKQLKTKDGMGIGIDTLVRLLTIQPGLDVIEGNIPLPMSVHMRWFWNKYPHFEDENNLSLVVMLEVYGYKFMFCGDMEKAGFQNMLNTNTAFRVAVSQVDILIAAHHGRQNGICEEMFDTWDCSPKVVVISDDYKQYSTQETSTYYARKAKGITGFRNDLGLRKVLTTRRDGALWFSFQNGFCLVG